MGTNQSSKNIKISPEIQAYYLVLHRLIKTKKVKELKTLLENNQSYNINCEYGVRYKNKVYWSNAIHDAIIYKSNQCLRLLLFHKANPDQKNANGFSPIENAIEHKNLDALMTLIRAKIQKECTILTNTTNDLNTCSICLNPMSNIKNIMITPCYHTFHIKCFRSFKKNIQKYKMKYSCPNCRQNLDTSD